MHNQPFQIISQKMVVGCPWELNCNMYWMVIYPVDSTIHLLNNWDLMDNAINTPAKKSLSSG